MGNHWHLICRVPGTPPSVEVVAERWNAYYGDQRETLDPELDQERCEEIGRRLCDLSRFMSQINQAFTFYYNRAHGRRGTLWADRFKSTILHGRQALWNCVKYVELNPVRAGLVQEPAAYRFSTWGWRCGSGSDFFGYDYFVRYLRASLGERAVGWSSAKLVAEFCGELARTLAAERRSMDPHEAKELAKKENGFRIVFLRRVRHWTDGGIIGSKAFIQDVGRRFEPGSRIFRRRLARGKLPNGSGEVLYSLKQLH